MFSDNDNLKQTVGDDDPEKKYKAVYACAQKMFANSWYGDTLPADIFRFYNARIAESIASLKNMKNSMKDVRHMLDDIEEKMNRCSATTAY